MGVTIEIGSVTEGAAAGTVGGSTMAIDTNNPHPGHRGVA